MDGDTLLTEREAAEFLGCCMQTLTNTRSLHNKKNGPPYVKLGDRRCSRIRYRVSDLQEWIKVTPVGRAPRMPRAPLPRGYLSNALMKWFQQTLSMFPSSIQNVLRFYYGIDDGYPHSLRDTGKQFDISGERVRQLEAKVIEKMKGVSREGKKKA